MATREELGKIDRAVMKHIGIGTTVSTLTHLLKNTEGMVVSKSQVQSAVNRLVKAGKLRLDPDRWPKLYVPLSEGRTTYHGRSGRFTSQQSAHTVTKGGERFKMVRQLRRIGGKAPEPEPESESDVVDTVEEAKAKEALSAFLSASPGWTPLHDIMGVAFDEEG